MLSAAHAERKQEFKKSEDPLYPKHCTVPTHALAFCYEHSHGEMHNTRINSSGSHKIFKK